MVQDTPSRKLDQYIVRFPDGMRDLLKQQAVDNNRSLNAEIIDRLSFTLKMHRYDKALQILLDLNEELLEDQLFVDIPEEMFSKISELAEERGFAPQKLVNTLIGVAIENMQKKTPLGEWIIDALIASRDKDKG